MAKERVAVEVVAEDKATAKFRQMFGKMNHEAKNFQKTFRENWFAIGAAIGVATLAIQKITQAIGGWIEAANRQEDAIRRLNNALQIQGEYTEEVSNSYQEMAKSLQRSTRYGDEAIMELQQTLISVGNVAPDMMERATKAAVDFAAATGRDLKTAALTIAKAGAGFTGELSRYGIILDDNIEKSKKFDAALGFIEKRFGGMAEKDVASFAGATAQLSNVWGDFREKLGAAITESESVKSFIISITNLIVGLIEKMDELSQRGNIIDIMFGSKTGGGSADLGAAIGSLFAGGGSAEGVTGGGSETVAAVQEQEANIWEVKLQEAMTGSELLKELETEAFDWKKNMQLEDKLFFIQNEREKFEILMQLTKMSEEQQKAANDRLAKMKAAEAAFEKKLFKERAMQYMQSSQQMLDAAATFFTMMQGESKKYAGVIKGIRIAEAVMNTAVAVTNALSTQPFFPVGMAMAAQAAAMGAAQVATISAQEFATGTDNVPAMLSSGEMVVPRSFAAAIRSGDLSLSGGGGGDNNNVSVTIESASFANEQDIDQVFQDFSDLLFERKRSR